jgi:CheY-like chemotaxis protein
VSETKTILYIDDKPDSLDVFRAHFEKSGDKLLTAATGKEGLALLAGNRVDAVVLDYQMPGMSGGAVLQIVKRAAPGLPVLVLAERSTFVPQDVRNVTTVVSTRGLSTAKLVRAVETIFETRIAKSLRRGAASA